MKQITFNTLCGMMDPVCYKQLVKQAATARFLVVFECQQLDSSSCGARTVMAVGPGKTYETLESLEGLHLKDLPSQREYPVAYVDTQAVERWAVEQGLQEDGEIDWRIWVIYEDQEIAENEAKRHDRNSPSKYHWKVTPLTVQEYANEK
jgi:hypothetical protein